jgi:hypothetical protein
MREKLGVGSGAGFEKIEETNGLEGGEFSETNLGDNLYRLRGRSRFYRFLFITSLFL